VNAPYIWVGTPKHLLSKLEKDLLAKPWQTVHEGMKVRLLERECELYVEAVSASRQSKENAMRRRKLKALVHGLNRLKRRKRISRDQLLKSLAVLKKEAGRVWSLVSVREPAAGEPVNRRTFAPRFDRLAWKKAMERDGITSCGRMFPGRTFRRGCTSRPNRCGRGTCNWSM